MTDVLIDRERFEESTAGDAELAQELLNMFRDQFEAYRQQLREQLDAGDRTTLGRTAHSLKGAALTLGFTAIAGVAKELEVGAPGEAVERLNEILGELESAYDRSSAEFDSLLSS